ncbi:MAG TPA: DUF1801 domain-containing protein [Anaerolineales bacterium]|nr:DUF1801 domain-containing protein [Anaerolineales bacterium]
MKSNKADFASMDEYIGTFPKDVQNILEEVRRTIKAAAPEAEEKISYNMPTFMLNGKHLIYFAGWKHHISLYPVPVGSDAFNKEVSKYAAGKGTLQFPLDKPLPLKLIIKIVKLRIEDDLGKAEIKSAKKK